MARVTLVFAALLAVLGLVGFLGTGSAHPTALIPTWIGLALGVFGFLAISPNEGRRKLFMHVNVTIGLLGFLGTVGEIVRSVRAIGRAMDLERASGVDSHAISMSPNAAIALTSKVLLAGLLLLYVILCVRSFIAARRTGKV